MELKFEGMKRTELQKCAKKAGIRANMKTEELIKALVAYHSQLNPSDEDINTAKNETEGDEAASTSVKIDSVSELTNEAKPQRVKKGRGRGRKKASPPDDTPDPEPVQNEITESLPKLGTETKQEKSVKGGRRGQRLRRKRTSVIKTPLEVVKTPKSSQKRSRSDDELVLPPAKQQRLAPASDVEKVSEPADSIPATRKSTRKRTFSMSPKSEVTENGSQSEMKATSMDGNQDGSSANEKRETGGAERISPVNKNKMKPETITGLELKTSPQKPLPATKKTGIPLPKIKASSENVTPGKSLNFKKAHKAQFEKLESIDDYLERKRKRIEALTQSYKKAPSSSKKTPKKTPKDAKPAMKRTSFFSPKPSKPTTKTVTFHASRLKTPAKPSTFVFGKASTEKRITTPGIRKSIAVMSGSVSRKSVSGPSTTPFKFSNTSVNSPATQKKFDLKASLSKPLTYKPYSGKLKPLAETQPVKSRPISHIAKAKENLKKPKLGSKLERQRAAAKHRTKSRKDNMMTRRGLSVV
ncbi:hypothetical protein BSL78_00307 [Apostichopus japonicus]|uniref:Nucleolar and spindle-associated protein 1 n=1 Tax=Stichopus japonicus TaxID=307972 RepID=A0A2G8LR43_STIJA|nr:hypothetical protein BSL78_00307 [Apostichopus japonicus]